MLAGYFGRWVDTTSLSRTWTPSSRASNAARNPRSSQFSDREAWWPAIAIAVIYLPISRPGHAGQRRMVVAFNVYVAGAGLEVGSHLRVIVARVAPDALGPVVCRHPCSVRSPRSSRQD
jgi:hypothetical protein